MEECCPCRVEFAADGPSLEERLRELLENRREEESGWAVLK